MRASPTSSEDMHNSRASFPTVVKQSLQADYGKRCVVCLKSFPSAHYAHVIDASPEGASHVSTGAVHGIIPADYDRASRGNGMVLCPTCHMSFFTPNLIALTLPLPILKYLLTYVVATPSVDQKPLSEVFGLLTDWTPGLLPDTESIEPFIGLLSIVILHPNSLNGMSIETPHLPPVSVIRDRRFVPAPANKSPNAPGVARIFDSLSLTADSPRRAGEIPLSPEHAEFKQRGYWRIPVNMVAVMVTLQGRVGRDAYESEEVTYTQNIFNVIRLQQCHGSIRIQALTYPQDDDEGGSEGPGDGEGPLGGGDDMGPSGSGAGPTRSGDGPEPSGEGGQSLGKRKRGNSKGSPKGGAVDTAAMSDPQDESRTPPRGVLPNDWEEAAPFLPADEFGDPSSSLSLPSSDQFWGQNPIPGALHLLSEMNNLLGSLVHQTIPSRMFSIGGPSSSVEYPKITATSGARSGVVIVFSQSDIPVRRVSAELSRGRIQCLNRGVSS